MMFFVFFIRIFFVFVALFSLYMPLLMMTTSISFASEPPKVAVLIRNGIIDCVPEGARNDKGNLIGCETSAIINTEGRLLLASDKEFQNKSFSQVFSFSVSSLSDFHVDSSEITYHRNPELLKIRKIEGFARDREKGLDFAISDFDWPPMPNSVEADPYNTMLFWRTNILNQIKVVSPSERGGVVSSRSLRPSFAKALANDAFPDGPPYFKIEGFAVLPNSKILFGVREVGNSYKDFKYTNIIISATYKFDGKTFTLNTNFVKLAEFYLGNDDDVPETLGISAIEFDQNWNRLIIATSFENPDTTMGGYLWSLNVSEIENNITPSIFRKTTGAVLKFSHKVEGLTVLSPYSIIVVHDDDRQLRSVETPTGAQTRKINQGIFSVINLSDF